MSTPNELVMAAYDVLEANKDFEGRDVFKAMMHYIAYAPVKDSAESVTFKELFVVQRMLQDRMGWPMGLGVQGFKESCLATMVEVGEALNELPWKPWKTYPIKDTHDKEALASEITDAFQFLTNGALAMGLTEEDLSDALRKKWIENRRRIDAGEVKSR